MATLNTIIQLRQGTTAEWNDSTVILKAGEMGLEYLTDGSVKIKAGNGTDLWGALAYIDNNANVYQVELEEGDLDDIAAIERVVNGAKKQNGDVAIVKSTFADDKISYTSYVYDDEFDVKNEDGTYPDGSTFGWSAMDGNYSASNVFIQKNIKLTKEVGNYAKDYNIAAGTSLEAILSGLLQKESQPTASVPTAEIKVSGSSGEVGSTYSAPTAKLNINGVGSYTYGPATGIVFNIGDIKLAEGADPTTASNYITNDKKVTAKTTGLLELNAIGGTVKFTDASKTYTFSGSAAYQAATSSPVTNLGNPSNVSAIPAGNCDISDVTATFTGWRRMYMGAVAKDAEINSDTIKAITEIKGQASKTTQEFTAKVGTEKILIAFPRNISTKAPKVQYFTMNWEDFGDFTLVADKVQVADAAGELTTNDNYKYMVYAYAPADPLKADTNFKVTLQ